MQAEVKEITSQITWDKFAQKFKPNNFLSSWTWTEFNDQMGDQTVRLGVYQNNLLIGICAASITRSKKGNFLLCSGTPLFLKNSDSLWNLLMSYLAKIAKDKKLKFIRIRPTIDIDEIKSSFFKKHGLVSSPVRQPAEITWLLSLKSTTDELLSNMRKTTRYLIKKAEKDGVEVIISKNPKDLEIFHNLEINTVAKHKYIPFSKKYVKTQFEMFEKSDDVLVFLAKFQGKIISSAIIIFYGDTAFYNHGASVQTKVPASYLIQWRAICEAKNRGKSFYNFWGGIVIDAPPSHPWAGITLFKTGFGGYIFNTLHSQDFPTSLSYWPIRIFEKTRYRLRGHKV